MTNQKTNVTARENSQEILISRVFNLPISSLFKAFTDSKLIEEWMGTKVKEFDPRNHGGYQFETSDKQGNVVIGIHGVFHSVEKEKSIIRTFEMENTRYPVQLEIFDFEKTQPNESILNMKIVFQSNFHRDEFLKLPFANGINMAHNRLENLFNH